MHSATARWLGVFILLLACAQSSFAQGFDRRDVVFGCEGIKCAGWLYVPTGLKAGEKRPAIVMAPDYSAVKEMYLDNFASKFAKAGFVVLVFDYRFFGASEGEPRGQLLWPEQVQDYRNAITWVMLQKEVDAGRIGAWGTSYSGAHVTYLAAYDRRIKAVVAQTPTTDVWEAYIAGMPAEAQGAFFTWLAKDRTERVASGKINYIAVAAPVDQPSVWPLKEWYEFFMALSKNVPNWANKITVGSLDTHITYQPMAAINRISPTPYLMIIAAEDAITPTDAQKRAFERAKDPKRLVIVPGRHIDAFGARQEDFANQALEWFKAYLMPQPQK
ncbi:MAG: alpha/beta hydrolase [Betaproteobacteria bacterium]